VTAVHTVRAEWLKLRKRPAVWIMILVLGLVVLLFGYLALYLLATQAPAEATTGLDRVLVLTVLSPENLPGQVLSIAAGFGGALGLILGALSMGNEFTWQTVKTITTQLPRRSTLLAGHAAGLVTVCTVMALTAFAGGALGSYVVTLLEPIDAIVPALDDLATAFGVTVLIIAMWCMIGMSLAMLFRGTGWAIGVGLLYTFALEQLLTLLPLEGRASELLNEALIGTNTNALVAWLSPETTAAFGGTGIDIDPLQAIAVLLAYLVVAVVIATVVFARRDIA
jgi:ABC-type transport system involved in multi-copper enzyme maturation permease subunit